MEKERIFHILKIEETKDETRIRQAYREQLKQTNPEEDQEGFKRLRQAYEEALVLARACEGDNEGEEALKSEIDVWLDKVEQLYNHLINCQDVRLWEELLADSVCDGLDTALEARERMLTFLMTHLQLPHKVWQVIDRSFQITQDIEALREQYPAGFLNYIKYYMENETFIPYELFRYRRENEENSNRDAYLNEYLGIKKQLDEENTEGVLQKLEDLQAYNIYHPYEDAERLKALILLERKEESRTLAKKLYHDYPEDLYICVCIGEQFWSDGEKEKAYELWQSVLEKKPEYYKAKYNVIRYWMETGAYLKAREGILELYDRDVYSEELKEWLQKANEAMISELKKRLETEELKNHEIVEQKLELGWCLFQNGLPEEALELAGTIQPEEEQIYAFENLYGQLLYHMKDYEAAVSHVHKWLELIEATKEDGTPENSKRISRRSKAGYILGDCYAQLGQWEKAKQYMEQAIEGTQKQQEQLAYRQAYAARLLEKEEYEQAVDVCDAILEADESYYPAYLIRQEAYYKLGKAQEVIDDYYRAIEIYPGFYKPYLFAIEVFLDYGQYEDLEKILENARKNEIEFSTRMKLCEIELLRSRAQNAKERKAIRSRLEELQKEIEQEHCDLEDKTEVDYEMALLCLDHNDTKNALICIGRAIEANPKRLQYRMMRGEIYWRMGKYAEAFAEYDAAEADYINNAWFYYKRGLHYEEVKNLDAAIKDLERVQELRDGYGDVYEKLADCYGLRYEKQYKRSDYERAVELMTKQLSVTENCYYLVCRGLLHMNAYEIEPAMEDFRKAMEYDPADWAVWNNLGCCYKYQGDFRTAIDYFQNAVEYMGNAKELLPYGNMADCYEALGEYEKAIECYRKNVKMAPTNQYFREEIGNCYLYMERYWKSWNSYDLARNQKYFNEKMGKLWLAMGAKWVCIWYYKCQIWECEKAEKPEYLYRLGCLYMEELGEYAKAVKYFRKAAALNSNPKDQFDYKRNMARCCYMLGQYEEAKAYGEAALDYFGEKSGIMLEDYLAYKPSAAEHHEVIGWLQLCIGQVQEAETYFEAMDQVNRCKRCNHEECYRSRMCMGYLYQSCGEKKPAKEQMRKALKRNHHSEECKRALARW